jgi:hypothetical protein
MWAAAGKIFGFFAPPKSEDLVDMLEVKDQENYKKAYKILSALKWFNRKVAMTMTAAALFAAWMFTPYGFVWAGDQKVYVNDAVEKVQQTVDTKIKAVEDQLVAIKSQNVLMQSLLNELVSEKVATDICRTYQRWIKEANRPERLAIRAELDSYQARYKTRTGENYPEVRCQ